MLVLYFLFIYTLKLYLFNLLYISWVLPGIPWLWMSELHLLKLKRKFKRDRTSHTAYMVWLLYVCSGNRSNSAPHLGYYAFEKHRKLSRAASIPLPA